MQIDRAEKTIANAKDKASRTLSRKWAIRAHCIECSGGSLADVRRCPATSCALFRWRMGKHCSESRLLEDRSLTEIADAAESGNAR